MIMTYQRSAGFVLASNFQYFTSEDQHWDTKTTTKSVVGQVYWLLFCLVLKNKTANTS